MTLMFELFLKAPIDLSVTLVQVPASISYVVKGLITDAVCAFSYCCSQQTYISITAQSTIVRVWCHQLLLLPLNQILCFHRKNKSNYCFNCYWHRAMEMLDLKPMLWCYSDDAESSSFIHQCASNKNTNLEIYGMMRAWRCTTNEQALIYNRPA